MNRTDRFLEQDLLRESKSETDMVRYMNRLVNRDYSLLDGMIPLGILHYETKFCKGNGTFIMGFRSTSTSFFQKLNQGYKKMIQELGERLLDIME